MTAALDLNPDEQETPDDSIEWQPSSEYLERSRLLRFCQSTENGSLSELREWAAADIGRYWNAVVKDLGLVWSRPYRSPVNMSHGAPWPEWFPGGGFNYVQNAVDRYASGAHSSKLAIIWEGDDGEVRSYTYGDLSAEVNRFANGLTAAGVKKGDRVGIFLPMIPEAVIATLACGKIGAVFTPLFSGYGEDAVASRLNDCQATVLITADAFHRRGRLIPMKSIADAAMSVAPTITTCITVQRVGIDVGWVSDRDHWWNELVKQQPTKCPTVVTNADDPYMIIYTSGTTGRPKGTVHVHAGFPIKATHDLAYCFDVQADDRLCWLTDLGWMMGPWIIAGGLMLNSTLVIYESTPDYPEPDRLWKLVESYKVTVLGVAPTAIRALKALERPAIGIT
jgi:acetyl-CoA synthetase